MPQSWNEPTVWASEDSMKLVVENFAYCAFANTTLFPEKAFKYRKCNHQDSKSTMRLAVEALQRLYKPSSKILLRF